MQLPLGVLFIAIAVVGGYLILTGKFPPTGPTAQTGLDEAGPRNSPGGGGLSGGNLTTGSGGMSVQSALRAATGGFR